MATMSGQTLSSVTGTVTDSSGGVIPNANVTVTNDATNVSKTAVTNSAGSYTVTDLLPGIYSIKVESTGFSNICPHWNRSRSRPPSYG